VIVDADAIARRLTDAVAAPPSPAIRSRVWGCLHYARGVHWIASPHARTGVHDPAAKQRLEAIIHPLVGQTTGEQARQAIDEGHPCVVFDIPLLVESGHWRTKLNRIIVVDCDEGTQIDACDDAQQDVPG
jgi:dephospho-CoA kinase